MTSYLGFENVEILKKAKWCMCYHCVKRFRFNDIVEFTDKGKTALCPRCSVDAVVNDLDRDEIVELHDKNFNFGSNPNEEPRKVVRIRENAFKKGEEWKN